MNLHEIITTIGIIAPLAYALGRFDTMRNADDITFSLAFIVGSLAVVSAAVAITLRFTG